MYARTITSCISTYMFVLLGFEGFLKIGFLNLENAVALFGLQFHNKDAYDTRTVEELCKEN